MPSILGVDCLPAPSYLGNSFYGKSRKICREQIFPFSSLSSRRFRRFKAPSHVPYIYTVSNKSRYFRFGDLIVGAKFVPVSKASDQSSLSKQYKSDDERIMRDNEEERPEYSVYYAIFTFSEKKNVVILFISPTTAAQMLKFRFLMSDTDHGRPSWESTSIDSIRSTTVSTNSGFLHRS